MTTSPDPLSVRRRDILSFVALVLNPLGKLFILSLFRPRHTDHLSKIFSNIYSTLWEFAEHSISHRGFSLPSSSDLGPVNRVNILLTELYGGRFASLSFGGSSGALLTLLIAVFPKLCPERDLILFDDVCHQSTIGGLIFGRWTAVRLVREHQPEYETVRPLTLEKVKDLVELHGPHRFAALVLVLPSYDGFRSPSEDIKIYNYAKSNGISVVVDGAWDALRFRSPKNEKPALSSICDVWITSPHKRGLTPSSLGCILTENEAIARLWDEALDLGFRSSSVSFVDIMIAEYRLEQITTGAWDRFFEHAEKAAKKLSERIQDVHPALRIVKPTDVGAETHDPTHILISTHDIENLDARRWAAVLSSEFAVDVEKSTASTLLLLCGSPEFLTQIDEILFRLKAALNISLTQNLSHNYDQ